MKVKTRRKRPVAKFMTIIGGQRTSKFQKQHPTHYLKVKLVLKNTFIELIISNTNAIARLRLSNYNLMIKKVDILDPELKEMKDPALSVKTKLKMKCTL